MAILYAPGALGGAGQASQRAFVRGNCIPREMQTGRAISLSGWTAVHPTPRLRTRPKADPWHCRQGNTFKEMWATQTRNPLLSLMLSLLFLLRAAQRALF